MFIKVWIRNFNLVTNLFSSLVSQELLSVTLDLWNLCKIKWDKKTLSLSSFSLLLLELMDMNRLIVWALGFNSTFESTVNERVNCVND